MSGQSESMSNVNSLSNKVAWSAAASVCGLFGRLIAQIIIARMLGPEGVGRIAYIVWLIEIGNILTCIGLPSSLTRYMAELYGQNKPEQAGHFAQWVFIRYLMLALLGSVVVGLLFYCSSQYAGAESVLPVLVFLFLAYGLQTINQANLAGRQRFDLLARINVAATIALVVGVSVGGSIYGSTGVLFGYIAGALFPAVYSFTILRGLALRQKIDSDLRRRIWKFTFNTWLAMLVSAFVWSRMEIFFLERYWGVHEVAMFTVGFTFAVMVQQAATLFSGAFMAHFSGLVGGGNHEMIQRHYETATRLVALVVVPLAFGGAAIMPVLLPLIFGSEFAPAIPSAMVLTVTAALAFSTIGSSLVYAKERSGFIALGGLAGAVLSVAAGFLIVSRFGVLGAVLSRLFVQSSMIVLGTWFIVARLHFSYPLKSLGYTAVAAGLCGLSAWGVIQLVPSPYIALGIAIPLGAIVYLLGVKFLRVLGQEEVRQLKKIADRWPARIQFPFHSMLDAMAGTR